MVRRVEFGKQAKLGMFKRAGGPNDLKCEECGLSLVGKKFEYDHTIECWERLDMQAGDKIILTAEDGKLLGKDCCHRAKSNKKKAEKAHGDRIIAKAAKATKKSSWRSKPDGYKYSWRERKYVKVDNAN